MITSMQYACLHVKGDRKLFGGNFYHSTVASRLKSYRQLHAERGPVEQVDPALDNVPGAVDGLVRRRRPSAATQTKVSASKITL